MSTNNAALPLSAEQCRAARGLIDWTQDQLAQAASVSKNTVASFERGDRTPTVANLKAMRAALEVAGVLFIEQNGAGFGVRLRDRR